VLGNCLLGNSLLRERKDINYQGMSVVDREAPVPFGDDFGVKNEEKEPENTYFLNTNLE
jgi:hypothetical protein